MTTYKITVKDNSIPEHMKLAIPNYVDTYTAIIECYQKTPLTILSNGTALCDYAIIDYINQMSRELNTDPENIEILSIIKQ
jgi:hypothetical protein